MDVPSGAGSYFHQTADDPFFHADTVNPEDLKLTETTHNLLEDLEISSSNNNSHYYNAMNHQHDSAIDLQAQWSKHVSTEETEYDPFLGMGESSIVNTPSPATDMIFSTSNSPGDFRDHSSVSSPDAPCPVPKQEPEMPEGADVWNPAYSPPQDVMFSSQDAIVIPERMDELPEKPTVHLSSDKTKTRAETQIKMTLTLDPIDSVSFLKFPRKTLAKPKHFASEEETLEIEANNRVLHMDVHLVCATAVEDSEDRARALRRAAGIEKIPRRPEGLAITEIDKEDPSHPQNGGEVLICDGCKERERKRYDRKKKRGEDEEEFTKYENDRVIMINEKEHRKLKPVESGETQFSSRARQVDFAMRIACYCRHQEEKSPQGYRVIFTFTLGKSVLVQHVSEVFHITDDHKNKELASESLPQRLMIPPVFYGTPGLVVPTYPYGEDYVVGMGSYSQPPTPIVSPQFTSPISPMNTAFSQSMPPVMSQSVPPSLAQPMAQHMPALPHHPRQVPSTYPAAAGTNAATFAMHQRGQSYYDTPLISPTAQYETHGLPRPQSMDNFNFNSYPHDAQITQAQQNQYYNSAPPSAGGTPINLSRPASPTWEQGPSKKGKSLSFFNFSR